MRQRNQPSKYGASPIELTPAEGGRPANIGFNSQGRRYVVDEDGTWLVRLSPGTTETRGMTDDETRMTNETILHKIRVLENTDPGTQREWADL